MATDNDANLILAELTATLRMLQQAGAKVELPDAPTGSPAGTQDTSAGATAEQ